MPKAQGETPNTTRSLRSDAAANRERLLAAAAVAVRGGGEKVPMATIAAAAGVGIGTLYRHYPTREALLEALAKRSYELVLGHATAAAESDEPVPNVIARFLQQTIAAHDDLVLPLHGGPIDLHESTVALRTEISDLLERVLTRGRGDGTIRQDVSAIDIIITGAMLAQPLPHAADWPRLANRQASIYVAGLATTTAPTLPGSAPTRRQLEAGFAGVSPPPTIRS
jgi:AcrR family transcriptional regulator